ncbi:MAG: hypothetical protein K5905_29780 [Roseibium sp.]|uniref:hypothetical protein n=1 Tax=Roseibium sp. TaxID=1936156 RepID=UPI0026305748|nr:hypothetical protein [Roseibium sp.]MCV0429652.1 hypothetical protein [Roseibium sp.]
MKIVFKTLLAIAGLTAILGTAAFAESGTVRIMHNEPYGAIVTKEAGVLVFRAVPPTRKVIVNPGGKTPLELKMTEVRETNFVAVAPLEYSRQLGAKIVRLK